MFPVGDIGGECDGGSVADLALATPGADRGEFDMVLLSETDFLFLRVYQRGITFLEFVEKKIDYFIRWREEKYSLERVSSKSVSALLNW